MLKNRRGSFYDFFFWLTLIWIFSGIFMVSYMHNRFDNLQEKFSQINATNVLNDSTGGSTWRTLLGKETPPQMTFFSYASSFLSEQPEGLFFSIFSFIYLAAGIFVIILLLRGVS